MKIYVNARGAQPDQHLKLTEGEVENVTIDWEAPCAYQGGTVSDVAWEMLCSGASLGVPTDTGNTSTIPVTGSRAGRALIQATATIGGQANKIIIRVQVRDPRGWCVSDYGL